MRIKIQFKCDVKQKKKLIQSLVVSIMW